MVKKKTLSALVAIFVFALFATAFLPKAVFAKAADGTVEVTGDFVYDETADKKTITGFNLPAGVTGDYYVTIPSDVEVIGEQAFFGKDLAGVRIPASVEEIGVSAFGDCKKLSALGFEARAEDLLIRRYAFAGCEKLAEVTLPDHTEIRQEAFENCKSLLRVNVGQDCMFYNNGTAPGSGTTDLAFFSGNPNLKIVFPDKTAYGNMLKQEEATFKNNHADACAYLVKVNYFVGASQTAVTLNQVNDEQLSSLYVQDASYESTVWYAERELTNAVTLASVNQKLATDSEINLYCLETVSISAPESVSWVYDDKVSYAISDKAQVLKAIGCEAEFTQAQLDALSITLVYKDAKGKVLETPEAIGESGVYTVMVSLDTRYGAWKSPAIATATVNVDSGWFNIVLIVVLVVGALALIITVTTAIVRKKVQQKAKKKQLSSQEVLEKFRATGGETTLK